MRRAAAAVAIATLCACGGKSTPAAPAIEVPARAATAGDRVLAALPAGADLVIELDLARLRQNPVIGDLLGAYLEGGDLGAAAAQLDPALTAGPLARADAVVMASYRVGTAQAAMVTVLVGGDLAAADLPGGLDLGDGLIAVAPPEIAAEVMAAATGGAPAIAADDELRALRARAMPARAEGAVLRVTARLSFDARVSLASQLGLEAAPAALSAWGDVADDLAVIAIIDAPDSGGGSVGDEVGKAAAAAIESWLAAIAADDAVIALGLAPALREASITSHGERVSVIATVGPRRLSRAAARARTFLSLTTPKEGP